MISKKHNYLIIIAHGSTVKPNTINELNNLAKLVRKKLNNWEVIGSTLMAKGKLNKTLSNIKKSDNIIIYPLFMSDGWFVKHQIPNILSEITQLSIDDINKIFKITLPLGCDQNFLTLCKKMINEKIIQNSWKNKNVNLLVVAHGSQKSESSFMATKTIAKFLETQFPLVKASMAFLEQKPFLKNINLSKSNMIALGLFANSATHLEEDFIAYLKDNNFQGEIIIPLNNKEEIVKIICKKIKVEAEK